MNESLLQRFKLTAIERDLVAEVVRGRSNADIARARQRSLSTVTKQMATMLRKFGVTTRRELLAVLLRESATYVSVPVSDPRRSNGLLSSREREVLTRVYLGHSNKNIAAELGVAESTIGVFLSRARAKLRRSETDADRQGAAPRKA